MILSSQSLNKKQYTKSHNGASVGFDFSLPKFLIGSDGSEYNSPLFYYNHQNKIKRLNKQLSSKNKGSKNI